MPDNSDSSACDSPRAIRRQRQFAARCLSVGDATSSLLKYLTIHSDPGDRPLTLNCYI
ncbi:hypothetical protein MTsPCn3_31950 [Erythrobacter sp. MTPC3]